MQARHTHKVMQIAICLEENPSVSPVGKVKGFHTSLCLLTHNIWQRDSVKAAVLTPWWFERVVNNHPGKHPRRHKLKANPSALPLDDEDIFDNCKTAGAVAEPDVPRFFYSFRSGRGYPIVDAQI